jgi:hypothetical protein
LKKGCSLQSNSAIPVLIVDDEESHLVRFELHCARLYCFVEVSFSGWEVSICKSGNAEQAMCVTTLEY